MSAPSNGPIALLRASWRDPARRNLVLTVGAGLAVQLMLVVTGPFLARLLGPAGRGDLAALMLWPVVLVQLGGLGIPAALTYYISRGAGRDETMRRALRFAGWQASVLVALQLLVVFLVFGDRGPEVRDAALLTVAAVVGILVHQYGLSVLQSHIDLRLFNALRVLPTTLFMVAVLVLFVTSAGLVAVTFSWVAATTAIGAITFTLAFLRRAAVPDGGQRSPRSRELLSFGIRGILSSNSATDIVRPEQIALVLFLPSRALGLYVVALSITNLPYFVAKAVGLVAFPAVAREDEPVAARRIAWRYLWVIAAIAGTIVVLLLLTAAILIPLFFGEDFQDSVHLSYVLLAGAFFTAVRRVAAECMRGRGQPGAGTTAEIVAVVWLLIALAALLPTIGVLGAAIGLASSQLVSFAVLAAIASRRNELHAADADAAWREGFAKMRVSSLR
jgi:O-antigen/teichoic acid export membrane protein